VTRRVWNRKRGDQESAEQEAMRAGNRKTGRENVRELWNRSIQYSGFCKKITKIEYGRGI
jgi:hypothetical protein